MVDEYKSQINIHRLDANLQRLASSFKCGNIVLDNFLKSPDSLNCSVGTSYVWLDEDNKDIVGYYNYTTGSLEGIDEKGDRVKFGGAIHLNEFAIAEKYQGLLVNNSTNMSDLLLEDFISRVFYIREKEVGFAFITLRSTDRGYSLYKRFDFEEIEEDMIFSPTEGKDSDGGKMMYFPLEVVE